MDILPQENTMVDVQRQMQMTLYDFLSGAEDLDTKMLTSMCLENLNSVDMNFIHRGQIRLQALAKCLRKISIEQLRSNGHSDPLFPLSSAPNVCTLQ